MFDCDDARAIIRSPRACRRDRRCRMRAGTSCARTRSVANGYQVLTRSPAAGVDTFVRQDASSLFLFFQGHPEYDAGALLSEFRRDVGRFLKGERDRYPAMPQHYFDAATEAALAAFRQRAAARSGARNCWRSFRSRRIRLERELAALRGHHLSKLAVRHLGAEAAAPASRPSTWRRCGWIRPRAGGLSRVAQILRVIPGATPRIAGHHSASLRAAPRPGKVPVTAPTGAPPAAAIPKRPQQCYLSAFTAGRNNHEKDIRRRAAARHDAVGGRLGLQAADVTYERLQHPEPQNWLMNHHDYSSQRFSALDTINKSNVKNLKLLFAVALGGSSGNESLEATPLVEDGFMYMADGWGVVYKIDVRSGTAGRIVWKMDPGQEKLDRNRGVALWGNLVISVTGYDGRVIATDKETGKIVWDKNLRDQPTSSSPRRRSRSRIRSSSAPRAATAACATGWRRSIPRPATCSGRPIRSRRPASPAARPGRTRTMPGRPAAAPSTSPAPTIPPANLTYWGTGNPVPGYDADLSSRATISTPRARSRSMPRPARSGGIHQYTPNDNRDYDETGTHIIIDTKVNGEDRKILSHAGRNGFDYILRPAQRPVPQGHPVRRQVTWTKGIDPKTGKPLEYDPTKDLQLYAEPANANRRQGGPAGCARPSPAAPISGRRPTAARPGSSTSRRSRAAPPSRPISAAHVKGKFDGGTTGVRRPHHQQHRGARSRDRRASRSATTCPIRTSAGVLSTAGGIVVTALLDGTIVALDDQTLDELWSINVGTGFNAPPMTYAVDGKQYIAIASGLFRNARNKLARSPDMKNVSNATMIFVFGVD